MWLIAGLGNPGAKYLLTRHNIGFMAVDHFISSAGSPPRREEKNSEVWRFKMENQELLFVKPQTFMNNSGEPIRALMDFYKIGIENLIVIHDDIDQGFGAIKIQKNRGAGGHNGLKSINEQLGSMDYLRLKLGVGRPTIPQMDVASHVLQNFAAEEQTQILPFLNVASDALESLLFEGPEKAATQFNRAFFNESISATSGRTK
jgi:PTH1 family peptidyl-tRNA hydrolase